jgi:hypothetical protein
MGTNLVAQLADRIELALKVGRRRFELRGAELDWVITAIRGKAMTVDERGKRLAEIIEMLDSAQQILNELTDAHAPARMIDVLWLTACMRGLANLLLDMTADDAG